MPAVHSVCVLPGDGIGPEVIEPAVAVLKQVAGQAGMDVRLQYESIGGDALDRFGVPLPKSTLLACRASDAVLLGAVGGPKWDSNLPDL